MSLDLLRPSSRFAPRAHTCRTLVRLAFVTTLFPLGLVQAQVIVAPLPQLVSHSRSGRTSAGAGDATGSRLSHISSALASGLPLIKRGPVSVRPHLLYRLIYGENIAAGRGNLHDSYIHTVSTGVLFEIGKHWTLDYTPSWTIYSNAFFRDSFDHSATLSGQFAYGPWGGGITQGYDFALPTLVETGQQTRQETISTSLNAARRVGQRTRVDFNVSRSARYANAIIDSPDWTTSDWLQYSATSWLRYEISSRLQIAAGLSAGLSDLAVGDDMTFTQPQVQITWQPADKITLGAQAGIESRRIRNDSGSRLESPVYSASLGYQIFSTTRIYLQATRGISASYFANEITKNSGWSASMEQRLLGRAYLSLSYSQQTTRFVGTRDFTLERRFDRYHSLDARLATTLFRRTSAALIFQTGSNTSDDATYSFRGDQIGFELSHRF